MSREVERQLEEYWKTSAAVDAKLVECRAAANVLQQDLQAASDALAAAMLSKDAEVRGESAKLNIKDPSGVPSRATPAVAVKLPAKRKEQSPELVKVILHGCMDAPELQDELRNPHPHKIISVFLSSTFTDTEEERNSILKLSVPKLQAQCAKHGYEFQVREMRWSIGKDESRNMQTSAICMAELTNCQMSSAGLNYVYIACNKYGFRPPPKTIPQDTFKLLLAAMSKEDCTFVQDCYVLDSNSVATPEDFKPPLPACGPSLETREAWEALDGPQFVLTIGTEPWDRFNELVMMLRTAAKVVWHQENELKHERDP
eukprot:3287356-Rhodomonas_salina.1